jgi:predicted AlkP superfamily pyrophosphatase or phosphodiesterase
MAENLSMHFLFRAACRVLFFLGFVSIFPPARAEEPPKLVVVILIDQLRYDYLDRFSHQFGEGGFKLLTEKGALMTNARYDYFPTLTGPGHASFLSGSPPSVHGIIGNDWWDKRAGKMINCVSDDSVTPVGTTAADCKRSPKNFVGGNFSDEMRLRYRSKVVGISLKDRGAILPAGKKPNGAYWFDGETGRFVTSTYYMKELPVWVKEFNDRQRAKDFLGQTWDRLLDPSAYAWADAAPGEGALAGEKVSTFPHKISANEKLVIETEKAPWDEPEKPKPAEPKPPGPPKLIFENIEPTPFGNQILAEFAEAAIDGEKLGAGPQPDVLTISFSSVDGAGHAFGPYSHEVQDIVLRLDRDLAKLLAFLDKKIGLGKTCIVLTADHGVMPTPEWAAQQGFSSERVEAIPLMADLLGKMATKFGPGNYLQTKKFIAGNLYFNKPFLAERKISETDLADFIREWALSTGKYLAAYTREQLLKGQAPGLIGQRTVNGYHAERSGDVVLIYKPYVFSYNKTGTTHGSPYSGDSHVPVIFYGAPFRAGRYAEPFNITDLAPTLCAALRVEAPAGSIGIPCVKALNAP